METCFQVVSKDSGKELGPVRDLLKEALEDRRKLAVPERAKIERVHSRSRGGMVRA